MENSHFLGKINKCADGPKDNLDRYKVKGIAAVLTPEVQMLVRFTLLPAVLERTVGFHF